MSLETSICPHFKKVVMSTKSSRPETWENLGLGEGRHLLHSVPSSRGRKGTTLPAALTSMPPHTKKENGGLVPGSHAQALSRVCTQNRTEGMVETLRDNQPQWAAVGLLHRQSKHPNVSGGRDGFRDGDTEKGRYRQGEWQRDRGGELCTYAEMIRDR